LVSPGRFTADDGSTDPDICAALRAPVDPERLRDAMQAGRLIVAVVASPADTGESGGSQMSVVSMVAADGRRGLLAFTGLDAMHRWNPHARPVPVSGPEVAQAALDDGCEAVVIDVAGPSSAVVAEPDLVELANRDPLDHAAALLTEAWASASGEASMRWMCPSMPHRGPSASRFPRREQMSTRGRSQLGFSPWCLRALKSSLRINSAR
jgi:hypothetical protein